MTRLAVANSTLEPWPDLWRMVVIALGTLILCSCRGPRATMTGGGPPTLPAEAYAGSPVAPQAAPCPAGPQANLPMPYTPTGPWAPPGISRPWPRGEYLSDGGDTGISAKVAPDWKIYGLETTDTVAHFDTLDGQTLVQPSNRVHLDAPRFGAVRKVVGLVENQRNQHLSGVHRPTQLVRYDDVQQASTSTQNIQAEKAVLAKVPNICRSKQGDGAVSRAVGPVSFQDAFLPYENLAAIRLGMIEESESAWLAKSAEAAIVWSNTQAVQVILDRQLATAATSSQPAQTIFTVNEPPARPKLRVIKVASTQFAEPGDTVDFTIRFDNVGNQVIGNVTIVDNLTTRLEFVPDSGQCSLPATFSTEPNEAGSLVVRCEITDPLPVGKGGILRFRCRVR